MGDYIFLFLPFAVIWVVIIIVFAQSWQVAMVFIPFALVALLNYKLYHYYFVYIPFLSVFTLDIHVLLKSKNRNFWQKVLPFLLPLPIVFFTIIQFKTQINLSILEKIVILLMCLFFLKFILGEPLLLILNKTLTIRKEKICYQFKKLKITQSGRVINFQVHLVSTETIEVSGFLYLYLKLKNIKANQTLVFTIVKGGLGITYIRGLPKVMA